MLTAVILSIFLTIYGVFGAETTTPNSAPKFAGHADLVTEPFRGSDKFKSLNLIHYSGYLESLNGVQLHYWFFESENSSANDPLVLWLNGGPGCSSMLGALTELGPIRLKRSGDVVFNEYAWTKNANILFLESPAGVGFSYNTSNMYDQDDNTTVELNVQALRSFYKKFPQFRNNRFFIAGESYAGIYIPTLSHRLVNEHDFKLEGILIGNGYLDSDILGNSLVHFHYFHGLMETKNYRNILTKCCENTTDITQCKIVDSPSTECSSSVGEQWNNVPMLNLYNIYAECNHKPIQTVSLKSSSSSDFTLDDAAYQLLKDQLRIPENENERQLYSAQLGAGAGMSPPCLDSTYNEEFLNDPQTLKALHISEHSNKWSSCRSVGYRRKTRSTHNYVRDVVAAGVKVLIYAGDTDSACNFIGNTWFVEQLGYKEIGKVQTWHMNRQVAGWKRKFENNVHLTIVRGAGHMVPEDKPKEALEMFQEFIAA